MDSQYIHQNQSFSNIKGKFSNSILDELNLFQDRLKTAESEDESMDFQIGPSSFPSHEESSVSKIIKSKAQILKLALVIISNKSKKALNALSFISIKKAAENTQNNSHSNKDYVIFPSEEFNIQTFVEKTLSQGSILQNTQKSSFQLKELYRRIFYLESQNSILNIKIDKLMDQIDEKQRTLLKQTQKKRQSLETFAEELKQKNDYIYQLKTSIKQLEKILGINHQRLSIQNVLIEDQLELKRNCLRLQNINERLNNDLKRSIQKTEILNNEINEIKNILNTLKIQNQNLKQKNFDITYFFEQNKEKCQVYSNLCQKLNKKIQSIRVQQKNSEKFIMQNKQKNSDIYSYTDLFASKKTQTSLSSIPLSRKSSLKDLETDQKIQEIFSFIFNIRSENYQLNNEDLFDQDELKLLKSHKDFVLINVHNQNPQINHQINKNNKHIENSFFNILESQNEDSLLTTQKSQQENQRLIQKISDLKKMHMHIRDLLLNFFKTIDFTQTKTQTLKILQVIFDFFEYSEDQKSLLIKEKRRKFWGII